MDERDKGLKQGASACHTAAAITGLVVGILTAALSLVWVLVLQAGSSAGALLWGFATLLLAFLGVVAGIVPNRYYAQHGGGAASRRALRVSNWSVAVLVAELTIQIAIARFGLWHANPFF